MGQEVFDVVDGSGGEFVEYVYQIGQWVDVIGFAAGKDAVYDC